MIAGTATGCATSTSPAPYDFSPVVADVAEPLGGCEWPELREGEAGAQLTSDGLVSLLECRAIARANLLIAAENAESARALAAALAELEELARRDQAMAEWQREQLERERRGLWIENLILKALAVLGIAGAAL